MLLGEIEMDIDFAKTRSEKQGEEADGHSTRDRVNSLSGTMQQSLKKSTILLSK